MTQRAQRARSVVLAVGLSGAVLAAALAGAPTGVALADAPAGVAPAAEAGNSGTRARISKAFGKLPLYFIENRGQLDSRVAYYVQGRHTSVFFTSRGVTFALPSHQERKEGAAAADTVLIHPADDHPAPLARQTSREAFEQPTARQRYALRLDFVDADPAVRPTGTSLTPAGVSYFNRNQT